MFIGMLLSGAVASLVPTAMVAAQRIGTLREVIGMRDSMRVTNKQAMWTPEELHLFRRHQDARIVKQSLVSAIQRGEGYKCCNCERDLMSPNTGMSMQMILTQEELEEFNGTTDADTCRNIIGTGRERAKRWGRFVGLEVCPTCQNAKTH